MRRLVTALATLSLAACASHPKPAPAEPEAPPTQGPATPTPPADPEAFRATPPQPGKPPELVLPTFQKATLDNGLTVLVSTRKELPLVFAGVAFASGSAQDPVGKPGLADLTYRMLLEGAGTHDTVALDNAFADLGVSPALEVSADGAQVGARVLTRNADAALALLSDVALRPTFQPKAFERRKKQQLADLVRRLGSPSTLGQIVFLSSVFGETHPYGHSSPGMPDAVQAFTLEDVQGFYKKHVGPAAAAIILTGDITLDEGVELAKKHFGAWKAPVAVPPVPPAPPTPARELVRVVPKPGLDQTVMMLGRPAIAAGNPDEYSLELATTVFGGFFGSRLNMNLREDKGYSYGAGAGVDPRLGVGPLSAVTSVRADVTGPALTEMMKELSGLKSKPITEKELAAAREGLIRAFPGAFESVEGLGSSAARLYFKRRPMDEFNRTVEGLRTATAEEVQRSAEQYLDPARMQVILVGDPLLIQEQVSPLELGKLTPVEPDTTAPGAPQPPSAGAP
ncbi:insulinase family protein [Myxococcus sp. K15C18031901]|uniref:M16 family metallopeptidase n=1 Tax=Myxococcus dinghuensis TaxID=2906761 RepID=UPI0020A76FBD|nr:pitrilysin family protein [Myxococcus dinghuensis]MCP3104930.1 insulinase family protein [Myxococcus dinghuensis]